MISLTSRQAGLYSYHITIALDALNLLGCAEILNINTDSDLLELNWVLNVLQEVQLTASLLQLIDLLADLLEKLLCSLLSHLLLLFDLLDEQSLVSLNGNYHHCGILNAGLYLSFFISLQR